MASTPSPVAQLVVSTGRPRPHLDGFGDHAPQVDANVGRQVNLVDHQNVALHHARAALAGYVVATGHVDDKQPVIDEIERERRRKIVPAAFDNDEVERVEGFFQQIGGLDVEGWVLADDGVRAGACFDGHDALGIDQSASAEPLGVLLGDQIVGDNSQLGAACLEPRDQLLEQGGFARSDGAADAHAGRRRAVLGDGGIHLSM